VSRPFRKVQNLKDGVGNYTVRKQVQDTVLLCCAAECPCLCMVSRREGQVRSSHGDHYSHYLSASGCCNFDTSSLGRAKSGTYRSITSCNHSNSSRATCQQMTCCFVSTIVDIDDPYNCVVLSYSSLDDSQLVLPRESLVRLVKYLSH
jgi:hypothetical protein